MKLDVLAFGAHPDDIELSCGGLLLLEKSRGKKTGIVDLTRGELGSRGSAEIRAEESAAAAKVLGVEVRENLEMADGLFEINQENKMKVIRMIRKYRPDVVICNSPEDRHPDHGRAAQLVSEAAFLSGLRMIQTELDGATQEKWRPAYVFNYLQHYYHEPSFLVDISSVIDQKVAAIKCYQSQFYSTDYKSGEPQTYISSKQFFDDLLATTSQYGQKIGVQHAEPYLSRKMVGIKNLDALVKNVT